MSNKRFRINYQQYFLQIPNLKQISFQAMFYYDYFSILVFQFIQVNKMGTCCCIQGEEIQSNLQINTEEKINTKPKENPQDDQQILISVSFAKHQQKELNREEENDLGYISYNFAQNERRRSITSYYSKLNTYNKILLTVEPPSQPKSSDIYRLDLQEPSINFFKGIPQNLKNSYKSLKQIKDTQQMNQSKLISGSSMTKHEKTIKNQ